MNVLEKAKMYPERFAAHVSIGNFLIKAIYSENYSLPNSFLAKIKLNEACFEFINTYRNDIGIESDNDLFIGAFLAMGANDYWLDDEKTDYDGLVSIVSSEIQQGKIRYPWIFGRDLMEKYSAQSFDGESNLNPSKTAILLDGTPQGVFQIGKYVCGPFGILLSDMDRHDAISPTMGAPIQFCPDPACRQLHTVSLTCFKPAFLDAFRSIRSIQVENGFEVPKVSDIYEQVAEANYEWYDSWNTRGFPVLLGNGFVTDELREIVAKLIDSDGKSIRLRFPKNKRLEGGARMIVDRLSNSELLQIALLATDRNIISAIETNIASKKITVPRGEVRVSQFHRGRGGWLDFRAECSAYGVRVVPSGSNDQIYVAQTRLRELLLRIFPSEESRDEQLDYILRGYEASSLEERLQQFISLTSPDEIIRSVFLPVVTRVKEVEQALRFGVFKAPDGGDGDDNWVQRVSWKLGYDSNYVESHVASFDEHHRNFYEVIRRNDPVKTAVRERIRQASISYFVALEGILDLALTFSVWALCSDHYGDTRFRFCSAWAKSSVIDILSEISSKIGSDIVYDRSGNWTLHPLIEGFRVLSRYLSTIEESDSSRLRDQSKYPGFDGQTDIAIFPFRHTQAFLDLSTQSKKTIIDHLEWVAGKLQAANVCGIRNRLEHNRPQDDFPTQEELENICMSVISIITRMEQAGVLPNPVSRIKTVRDQFGRELAIFEDFRGRDIEIRLPHELNYSMQLDLFSPVVVFPYAIINQTSVPLQFNWIGVSKYSDYWRGHPGRR